MGALENVHVMRPAAGATLERKRGREGARDWLIRQGTYSRCRSDVASANLLGLLSGAQA